MKRDFVFLLSIIFIINLFIFGSISTSAQEKPDSEEYLVYTSLLEHRFIKPEINQLVIRKQTMIDDFEEKSARTAILDASKFYGEEIMTDFQSRNKTSAELTDNFNLKVRINLLAQEQIVEIFAAAHPLSANQDGWNSFYEKYPSTHFIITFSRVGFNKEKTKAFVFVGDACGPTCGEGNAFWLLKKDSVWKVEKESMKWIS